MPSLGHFQKINLLERNEMKYTVNSLNILTAKMFRGIGRAWIVKYLNGVSEVGNIVSIMNFHLKPAVEITVNEFETTRNRIIHYLEQSAESVDGVVAIGDLNFPQYRGSVKIGDQPVFLFYRGNLNLLQSTNKNISVIGLLNPDVDIEIIEKRVVSALVEHGATIVSGLAIGCDTIAHQEALHSKGQTVAILPSPIDNILPASNRELAREIVREGGLLVSEYFEGAKSRFELSGRYRERDRLQALFSDTVILSASYAKNDQGNDSGSRLAMEYALDYKIPRAVIYEPTQNLSNPKYDLNRQLISEQKDITIISQNNIVEAVGKLLARKTNIKFVRGDQGSLFD